MTYLKMTTAVLLATSTLLSACGGGGSSTEDNQQITSVTVRALAYSRQAVLFVSGTYLRADMTAVTGACKDPVFNMMQSTPQLAVLNCTVTATGEQPLSITGTNGKVLYTGTVTVPQPQIELVTSQGSLVLELNPAAAPVSVNNFLTYANGGFYNNTLFHRVIAGFVVQGGGYTKGLVKKADQLAPIVLESNNGLLNTRGTLAMARTSVPNSEVAEFFVHQIDKKLGHFRVFCQSGGQPKPGLPKPGQPRLCGVWQSRQWSGRDRQDCSVADHICQQLCECPDNGCHATVSASNQMTLPTIWRQIAMTDKSNLIAPAAINAWAKGLKFTCKINSWCLN